MIILQTLERGSHGVVEILSVSFEIFTMIPNCPLTARQIRQVFDVGGKKDKTKGNVLNVPLRSEHDSAWAEPVNIIN